MEKKDGKVRTLFILTVVFATLLSVSVGAVYPADWLRLNRALGWVSIFVGILFWTSLLMMIVMKTAAGAARRKAEKVNAKKIKQHKQKRRSRNIVFSSVPALLCLLLFVAGTALSAVFLAQNTLSRPQTFIALATAVFGLTNYINFNSKTYLYLRKNQKMKNKINLENKKTEECV